MGQYAEKMTDGITYTTTKSIGYHMDYDLTTDGELNDLTIQIEFLKHGDAYSVSLEDLHTL